MPHTPSLQLNLALLQQGMDQLDKLDDEGYRSDEPRLRSGGVGIHFRHCIDFYDCFTRGVGEGRIDYDHRTRDRTVENDRAHALDRFREIYRRLDSLADAPGPLRVRSDLPQHRNAEEDWAVSSLFRELQFLAHHTIHHYALIAAILRLRGTDVAEEFGVAPSTLHYWKETGGRAR